MSSANVTGFLSRVVSATDPGRARFKLALTIAAGMLLSVLGAWAVVTFLHADAALLTVGVFLAMQMGLTPKDPTARARCATTALLILPTSASAVLATLLSHTRPLEIVGFVCVAGAATWVRKYGPRAAALGAAGFFGYFFVLLLGLKAAQIPYFLLVAAIAVASLTLMRALLISEHPRRQIDLLLREFRSVSLAAIDAAEHHALERPKVLRNRLARLDAVAHAITVWQQDFDTEKIINIDEDRFASIGLNARISVEQACSEIVHSRTDADTRREGQAPEVAAALNDLRLVLNNRTPESAANEAAQRATALLSSLGVGSAHRTLLGRLARGAISQEAMRSVDLTRAYDGPARAIAQASAASAPAPAHSDGRVARVPWWNWKTWPLTTRLTVQVMVAMTLAVIVGEAISASRWYWAVLTAFIVFVGATTRGGILTRAYNRVAGTLLGVTVGVGLVLLAHDSKPVLIGICVLAAFGMMYLGPVRYLYTAFCISVMLVSMYGLLGELDTQILELRIGETLAGAVLGVLCAYFIFSSNSRPALLSKVDAYFAAFADLLSAARQALTTPANDALLLPPLHRLNAALLDVDKFVASMSAALPSTRAPHRAPIIHLLYLSTRATESFAQSAAAVTTSNPPRLFAGDAQVALDQALDHLRATARTACASLSSTVEVVDPDDTVILDLLPRVPFDALSPQSTAMVELSRINWVMLHISLEQGEGWD